MPQHRALVTAGDSQRGGELGARLVEPADTAETRGQRDTGARLGERCTGRLGGGDAGVRCLDRLVDLSGHHVHRREHRQHVGALVAGWILGHEGDRFPDRLHRAEAVELGQ